MFILWFCREKAPLKGQGNDCYVYFVVSWAKSIPKWQTGRFLCLFCGFVGKKHPKKAKDTFFIFILWFLRGKSTLKRPKERFLCLFCGFCAEKAPENGQRDDFYVYFVIFAGKNHPNGTIFMFILLFNGQKASQKGKKNDFYVYFVVLWGKSTLKRPKIRFLCLFCGFCE